MRTSTRTAGPLLASLFTLLLLCAGAMAQELPSFDFTKAPEVARWQADNHIAGLTSEAEGMRIAISGGDPFLHGPTCDYPVGVPLWINVRVRSDEAGTGQIFFFTATRGTNEADSVRFSVPTADEWTEARVPMPALGPGTRLRLDPPGTSGTCLVAAISFEPRVIPATPEWPKPVPPDLTAALSLTSGAMALRQAPDELGGFVVEVAGRQVAIGNTRPLIGYTHGGQLRWLQVAEIAKVAVQPAAGAVLVRAAFDDPDGGRWVVRQDFTRGEAGSIDVETRVTVSEEREVVYLPMLLLHPGVGSFGAKQDHALFAGLEYMDAPDTSSSEADITGPGSKRQTPEAEKVTFPLMAIQAEGRYVGLIWDKLSEFCPVFDSPDRLYRSGGHTMGVLFPGSDGLNREEGSLLPYGGVKLAAREPLRLAATIIGGEATSVVPAVQQYVALRGLPPVPDPGRDRQNYAAYAAAGWLDSSISEDSRYRHAYWPGATSFTAGPAADPALWMDWLARVTTRPKLAARLEAAAQAALAQVEPASYNVSGVSHVRYPVGSLVYGHVAENTDQALEAARGTLASFEPDGSVVYRQAPGALDYGKTHFAPDANGLSGARVMSMLEYATVCGDPEMLREGLRVLRALDKFDDSTPRGAQTWEVPLHTPDILASAYLVRAYTMGYELTGDRALLDRAIYWAWTGVPFTYLVAPTERPVGLYATIPVFGATQWVGSWFKLPVQWCGLVYSDALYRLIRHDPANATLWRTLADGITASGIQQSFPTSQPDLQGLLPDSFNLRPQTRNGVAINPGTLQASAVRLLGGPEVYDFHAFREAGILVHAPGAITDMRASANRVSFAVHGWVGQPYYVLVVGLTKAPRVRIDGKPVTLAEPHQYLAETGRLILQVQGSPRVEVGL